MSQEGNNLGGYRAKDYIYLLEKTDVLLIFFAVMCNAGGKGPKCFKTGAGVDTGEVEGVFQYLLQSNISLFWS